jgi:hypothetical protein
MENLLMDEYGKSTHSGEGGEGVSPHAKSASKIQLKAEQVAIRVLLYKCTHIYH